MEEQVLDYFLIEMEDLLIDLAIDEWHWNGNEAYVMRIRFRQKLLGTTITD